MRIAFALLFAWVAGTAVAQVDPADLTLTVTVEKGTDTPFVGEMVLLTIHGQYRRHITRARVAQPDLGSFSWMQLGQDYWFDDTGSGIKVKNFKRRMALFPERSGTLTIGPFVHHVTLLDADNKWFEHEVRSEPATIEVLPQPEVEGWWLPVRRLEVSDNWSNPPDQLQPGEGVLRIIRVEAVGIAPERMPPMPELTSPSGHVYPHPEKRIVSLSPYGPVSTVFWRWTIRPDGPSAILEPITFGFYDTTERVMREVVISPQRVAMAAGPTPGPQPPPEEGRLTRAASLTAMLLAAVTGSGLVVARRRYDPAGLADLRHRLTLRWRLWRACRRGDPAGFRRAAEALARLDPDDLRPRRVLAELDAGLFGHGRPAPDLRRLQRKLRTPAGR